MKMRVYTEAMVEFLRSNVDKYSWSQLTKLFNQNFGCDKTEKSIFRLCQRNEIVKEKPFPHYRYTKEMVDFLLLNIDKYNWFGLVEIFNTKFNCNKSIKSIMRFCAKNKIMKQDFTEEMLDFLRDNFKSITYEELAMRFNAHFAQNKKAYTIKYQCKKNGITPPRRSRTLYTEDMIDFLRANADKYSWAELTKRFNLNFNCENSRETIMSFCYRCKIGKSKRILPDEMVDFLRANYENMNHEELARCFNNKFNTKKKKYDMNNYCTKYGLRRSNPERTHPYTLPVGSEKRRICGWWIYVKVDYGKWKAKHHLIWEQVHGAIPKGHLVVFADGNTENFDIDNLILMTRREFLCFSRNPVQLLHANEELRRIGINIAKIQVKLREHNEKQSSQRDAL